MNTTFYKIIKINTAINNNNLHSHKAFLTPKISRNEYKITVLHKLKYFARKPYNYHNSSNRYF